MRKIRIVLNELEGSFAVILIDYKILLTAEIKIKSEPSDLILTAEIIFTKKTQFLIYKLFDLRSMIGIEKCV
jgi:hypothetical protein